MRIVCALCGLVLILCGGWIDRDAFLAMTQQKDVFIALLVYALLRWDLLGSWLVGAGGLFLIAAVSPKTK